MVEIGGDYEMWWVWKVRYGMKKINLVKVLNLDKVKYNPAIRRSGFERII